MAILAFQKPDKVLMLEANNTFGKFEFRPLEPGYGVTVGNALRRILLSGLEGYAICNIRIDGVQHEFATIPGVKEDVTNVILNLKKVRLNALSRTLSRRRPLSRFRARMFSRLAISATCSADSRCSTPNSSSAT